MPFLLAALGVTAIGAVLTVRRIEAASMHGGSRRGTSEQSPATPLGLDTSGVARAQAELRAAMTGPPDFSSLLNPTVIKPNLPATPNLMPSFEKVVAEIR